MTRGITIGGRRTNKVTAIFTLLTILSLTVALSTNLAAATNPTEIDITNITGQKTTINYDQILAMPNNTEYAELYCYGTLVTIGQWTGVKISDLLNSVNADLTAGSIEFIAQDGYKITIPMEIALQPNVILAYTRDGSPLAEIFRLVLPGINGNMWISMVSSLTLSDASADNIASTATGPVINMHQNLFTQNTAQPTQTTQPKPSPSAKPSTPSPAPSIIQTPPSASLPSANNASSGPLKNAQNGFLMEFYYAGGAAIVLALVLIGVLVKRKSIKNDL